MTLGCTLFIESVAILCPKAFGWERLNEFIAYDLHYYRHDLLMTGCNEDLDYKIAHLKSRPDTTLFALGNTTPDDEWKAILKMAHEIGIDILDYTQALSDAYCFMRWDLRMPKSLHRQPHYLF